MIRHSLICLISLLLAAPLFAQTSEPPQFKVLFTCSDPALATETGICMVNADGTGLMTLVTGGVNSNPVWSLTGSEFYFAHDSGPVTYQPEGLPKEIPPIPMPSNTDLYSFNLTSGASTRLTDRPELEIPSQGLPSGDLLVFRSAFIRQAADLGPHHSKLSLQLKLIYIPCLFSVTSKECTPVAEISQEPSESSCSPHPLPASVGVSPDGAWMSLSASLCGDTARSDREPGLLAVNKVTHSTVPIRNKDLGPCIIHDIWGGRAIETDGTALVPGFDVAALNLAECRLYLSPDRLRFAFLDNTHLLGIVGRDGSSPMTLTGATLEGVNRLSWAMDGSHILAFHETEGPLIDVSLVEFGKVTPLGVGTDPSWSPAPMPPLNFAPSSLATEPAGGVDPVSQPSPNAASGGCAVIR